MRTNLDDVEFREDSGDVAEEGGVGLREGCGLAKYPPKEGIFFLFVEDVGEGVFEVGGRAFGDGEMRWRDPDEVELGESLYPFFESGPHDGRGVDQ